jgi:predicted nucleic acid-binding protein
MKIAFADSSFYVALLISRDANHAKAKTAARSWTGAVVTTDYVLTEVANYMAGNAKRRAKFGQLHAELEADPNTRIIESSHELWSRGVNLYLQRPDKEWSLTDCISFVVMEEHGLHEALTADHHFEQAGFKVLLGQQH